MSPGTEAVSRRSQPALAEIGLQPAGMITIRWATAGTAPPAILVVGHHRLEACRRLGWKTVTAAIFDGDETTAEAWALAENFARADLTALERAEHVARWVTLQNLRNPPQVSGGRGNRSGVSEAARTLGTDRRTVQRSLLVAGLSADAKDGLQPFCPERPRPSRHGERAAAASDGSTIPRRRLIMEIIESSAPDLTGERARAFKDAVKALVEDAINKCSTATS